jgi:hypothetical protein
VIAVAVAVGASKERNQAKDSQERGTSLIIKEARETEQREQ